MQRSQYILVGIAALLALSVFTLALFSFFRPGEERVVVEEAIVTPTQTELPPVVYEKSSSDRMLEIVNNRTPLNRSDAAIRESLIAKSENQTYLYTSKNTRLEYLSSPDQFMAEILTGETNAAKNEVASFLSKEGLSPDAICHLPLVFYLSLEARRALPENAKFNPLPDNC